MFTVPNIEFEVLVSGYVIPEPLQRPRRVSIRPEKHRSLIVVDTKNLVSRTRKVNAYLGTDQTT